MDAPRLEELRTALAERNWSTDEILGDSRGRPEAVPDLMDVTVVASVRYVVHEIEWELKAIRVSAPTEARWIPFVEGLPGEPR